MNWPHPPRLPGARSGLADCSQDPVPSELPLAVTGATCPPAWSRLGSAPTQRVFCQRILGRGRGSCSGLPGEFPRVEGGRVRGAVGTDLGSSASDGEDTRRHGRGYLTPQF